MTLMSRPYHPKIELSSLAMLKTVAQQMKMHPGYFDKPDCPYDDETIETLKKLLEPEVVTKEVKVEVPVEKIVEIKAERAERAAEGGKTGPKVQMKSSGVDQEAVSAEIQGLRKELQQLKTDSKGLQTSDKLAIIKIRAGLVEKLVSLDERVLNLKQTSRYQSTIMGILDDLVGEDGRKEFIRRIEPFAREEG